MSDARAVAMKRIVYRGGLVTFELPSHWVEEYEPEGGGTFYDAEIEAVTLRLNVLTFRAPAPIDAGEAMASARRTATAGCVVEALDGGHAFIKATPKPFDENGEALELWSWRLSRVAPPDSIRIAIFNATVVVAELESPTTRALLAMIDQAIRGAVISTAPGVVD